MVFILPPPTSKSEVEHHEREQKKSEVGVEILCQTKKLLRSILGVCEEQFIEVRCKIYRPE